MRDKQWAIFLARVIGAALTISLTFGTSNQASAPEGIHQMQEDNPISSKLYADNPTAESFLQLADQRFDDRNGGEVPMVQNQQWTFEHVQVRGNEFVRVLSWLS